MGSGGSNGASAGSGMLGSTLYGALASTGTAILRASSCHQVFVTLARELTGNGDFQMACVALPDPDATGGLTVVAHGGTAPRGTALLYGPDARSLTLDHPMVALAIADARAVNRSAPEGSASVIPIDRGLEGAALLVTTMSEPDAYDEERAHLLERLADEVSFALRSIASREAEVDSRLARSAVQAELATRAHMHAALARISRISLDEVSVDELLLDVAQTVRSLLNLDSVIVEALQSDGSAGPCAVAGSAVARSVIGVGLNDRHALGARLRADGGPFVVSDLSELAPACAVPADPKARSVAAVVIGRPEVRGAIVASGHVPRRFAADQIDFLESLAGLVSSTLDHRDASERLLAHALQDELTGLPNRTHLYDRLEAATAALRPGRSLAVLLVDLDGFKLVNEAYGHDVGDRLLVGVADRLAGVVRGDDVVVRLGGDEFGVLCVDLPDRAAAEEVADRLAAAIAAPFDLGAFETFITASVGITLHEGPPTASRGLLGEADAALYVAKESGRAGFEVFDDEMRATATRRLQMTNDLRRALVDDELTLVWHPIVDLLAAADGEHPHLSLEALVRWRHPELGLIRPDAFIGLAEDTGLIRPLGEWVLTAAAEQVAAWRRDDPLGCPDLISVNLSAHQVARASIVDTVHRAFSDAEVEPSMVELEITETAFLSEPVGTVTRLRELTDLGFVIAIDDFGTGYSSMSYLRDLPASALKIDRSFVDRLGKDARDDAIVAAIVGLAHAVGLVAVAEGVETEDQLTAVRAMGCDRAQGFLWTEPLDPADVPGWIRAYRRRS